MPSAITPAAHAAPVAPPEGPVAKSKQSPPKSAATHAHVDTVQLSSAAQAALKELTETPAQTAQEAGGGDLQAQRLLAKETAATTSPAR